MAEKIIEMYKPISPETLSENEIFPDIDSNPTYQTLLARFMRAEKAESDEFIISEALKIYSELDWDEYDLKIRLLELLKDKHF